MVATLYKTGIAVGGCVLSVLISWYLKATLLHDVTTASGGSDD